MLSRDEFETLINNVKGKINDTDSAMVSEDLLGALSSYSALYDENDTLKEESSKLKKDNEELLKVNGRLFQKIGFEKPEKETDNKFKDEEDEEIITLDDLIDEKGDFK